MKPERDLKNRKVYREIWWQYAEKQLSLYSSIDGLNRVLTVAQTSRTQSPVFVRAGQVFSHKIIAFVLSEYADFAVLCNSLHYHWVLQYGSTMRTDAVYTPTDCFETFPFPTETNGLNEIGERYYTHRKGIMLAREEGLTKTYNRFHSSEETAEDIQCLRELHVKMDYRVSEAYGWSDLNLNHNFHETKPGLRFTISDEARREVLDRLLELNHERYAEEVREGLHDKKNKSKKSASSRGRAPSNSAGNLALFTDTDLVGDGGPMRDISRRPSSAMTTPKAAAIDGFDTNEVMAAFRQAARGQGAVTRDELLKEVSTILGYQRLGSKVDETLRGHLRAAIRRGIIEDDAGLVRAATTTMNDYSLEELRTALCSVMRKGTNYEREEATYAVARHLGFARVTDSVRDSIKSAINSAIRQGILGYEGSLIWREE